MRVCLDPRDLNKTIKREHYPVRTVESVATQLHGSTLFPRLDAKSAYWNAELDEESSYLTTFKTHRCRFRYKRMSYWLNSLQTFERCKVAIPIADDMQVVGSDDNHDMHLHEAMERVKSAGIKF